MIDGMNLVDTFGESYNCAYTTTTGEKVQVSIPALIKLMEDIPEPPRILTMDISLVTHRFLPPNTILISTDIAEALEEALKGTR